MEKRIKGKIGVLVILGMFAVIMMAQPVAPVTVNANDITMVDADWIGFSSSDGRIVFDNQAIDEIEMMDANLGIGDDDLTYKLEVNGEAQFNGALRARSGTGIGLRDDAGNLGLWVEDGGEVGIGTISPVATLDVDGGFAVAIRVVDTTPYTPTSADHTLLVDTSTTAVTINLPQASTVTGLILVIKVIDNARTTTIDGFSAEAVDGGLVTVITTIYTSYMIQSDGSNWWILANNP